MNYVALLGSIAAITQWIKKRFGLNGKIVVVIGFAVGIVANFIYGNFIVDWKIWECIIAGLFAGGVTGGFYDYIKEIVGFVSKLIDASKK